MWQIVVFQAALSGQGSQHHYLLLRRTISCARFSAAAIITATNEELTLREVEFFFQNFMQVCVQQKEVEVTPYSGAQPNQNGESKEKYFKVWIARHLYYMNFCESERAIFS